MKFLPSRQILYTDQGLFLKQLSCPLQKKWTDLQKQTDSRMRHCDRCNRSVLDTALLTDEDVATRVVRDPSVCLRISASQSNVTIIDEVPDALRG